MLGLRDSRISLTLGAALCCACPPAPTNDTDTDTSTGSTTGSTTGDGSTTGEPTTGASTGPQPSTGEGSTGEPALTCADNGCSVRCTQMTPLTDDNGNECFCEESPHTPPDGWQTCELPAPCGDPADYVCMIQALRWGVVSRAWWHGFAEDDGGRSLFFDILGDGTVRANYSTFEEHKCCDDSSQDFDVWYDPFTVPPPDAAFWQSCLTEKAIDGALSGGFSYPIPFCLDPKNLARACTGAALDTCPTPPPPGDCAASCPMAGDGVCDEPQGTGLCAADCDPLDCTCEPDTPDLCDEIHRGGACPIGSDPDDCTCEGNSPDQCDEVDGGGSCPKGSDSDCD